MFARSKATLVATVLVALVTLIATPLTVSARTISLTRPNFLLDNFSELQYGLPWTFNMFNPTPEPDWGNQPYWWPMENSGYMERDYNMPCSSAGTECVTHGVDANGKGYVRMMVSPYTQMIVGEYHEAALTETNHGFSYNDPKRWVPEVGKPVILTATVRWNGVYKSDGTGGFVGSSGVYLWNMPADYTTFTFHAPKAIGLDLMDVSAPEGMSGLGVTVADITNDNLANPIIFPANEWVKDVYTKSIDLTKWMQFTMIWSVDRHGTQHLKAWINLDLVTDRDLARPLPPLAVELWNDNYLITDMGDGTIMLGTQMINTQQNFDIGFISVLKM